MTSLSDAQVRSIEDRLRRIESDCRGDRRTANNVRIVRLTLNKARRRGEKKPGGRNGQKV